MMQNILIFLTVMSFLVNSFSGIQLKFQLLETPVVSNPLLLVSYWSVSICLRDHSRLLLISFGKTRFNVRLAFQCHGLGWASNRFTVAADSFFTEVTFRTFWHYYLRTNMFFSVAVT